MRLKFSTIMESSTNNRNKFSVYYYSVRTYYDDIHNINIHKRGASFLSRAKDIFRYCSNDVTLADEVSYSESIPIHVYNNLNSIISSLIDNTYKTFNTAVYISTYAKSFKKSFRYLIYSKGDIDEASEF